jgi:5-methylcytosine-specific restriction endonuclease McrA
MPISYGSICTRCGQSECRCKQTTRPRKSSHKRGYGRTWRQWRERYITHRIRHDEYHCDDCKRPFNASLGIPELHHIEKVQDNPARRLDATNVMMLCKECHAIRTARGE